jgi:hypothetical protein
VTKQILVKGERPFISILESEKEEVWQLGLGKSSTSPTTFRKVPIVADDDRLMIVVADSFIWPVKVADDGRLLIVVADDVGRRSSRYTPILPLFPTSH